MHRIEVLHSNLLFAFVTSSLFLFAALLSYFTLAHAQEHEYSTWLHQFMLKSSAIHIMLAAAESTVAHQSGPAALRLRRVR